MKKLWKRLVMLGALVGCMATAAWAGNVEVDIGPDSLGEGAQIQFATDGFYLISQDDPNAETIEYEYHFNKNGLVAWKKDLNGVTQYTYDENGNVIKAAYTGKRGVLNTKQMETYAYDEQGRLLIYERNYYESYNTYQDAIYQKAVYTYEDHRICVEDVLHMDKDDYTARERIEYTFNEKNQVEAMKTCTAYSDEDYGEPEETNFLYDENDNLIQETSARHTYVYTYDKTGRCIKEEGSFYYPRVYDYDENGNVISISEVYNADGQEVKQLLDQYNYEKIAPVQDDSVFTDVTDKNGFAYDAIIWATEMGITKGTTETTFSPRAQCTRAQMVTFLWRAAGSPEPTTTENPFTDVKEGAYYKAILWAVENGITKGTTADKFSPNAQCTRAQIVTFIYRAAGEPEVEDGTNPFTDVKSGAYYDAILWAVENGITNGTTATTFSPSTVCNRGQGVTFLYRGIGLY